MALQVRKTSELIDPSKFKLKVLVFAPPGTGKTEWASSAPDPGFVACETGQGKGLLTIASKGIEFVEPRTLSDIEEISNGKVFANKESIVLDSLSELSRTIVKDSALSIPRRGSDSEKRARGVPELDDYGVMAEITRKICRKFIDINKHIIVTATENIKMPDQETGRGEVQIGPDLPGQMFLGSTAMFDFVLRLRVRSKLRDPKDAKSRYAERYFITNADGVGTIAKCRSNMGGKSLLDQEEIFDLATGQGTIPYLLEKIKKGYAG